jgi:hypothetical protein
MIQLHKQVHYTETQLKRDWRALQRDLAGLSSDRVHIIATRSVHQIQLDQPDLVIAATKQVFNGKV